MKATLLSKLSTPQSISDAALLIKYLMNNVLSVPAKKSSRRCSAVKLSRTKSGSHNSQHAIRLPRPSPTHGPSGTFPTFSKCTTLHHVVTFLRSTLFSNSDSGHCPDHVNCIVRQVNAWCLAEQSFSRCDLLLCLVHHHLCQCLVAFFFDETKMSPPASVLVNGGAPGERRQTSENKKREERTTVAPQQRDKAGLKGLHNSLAKERSSSACTSTRAVGCSLEGSARKLKLRMQPVFSRKTGEASGAFTMVSTEKHAAHSGDPTREKWAEACRSQARSSR